VGVLRFLVLNWFEHFVAIDSWPALLDNCVADLSDKHNKSRRCVVVLRVVPDQKNCVHDWDKLVCNLGKLLWAIRKIVEQVLKGLEILVILVCLFHCNLYFLLQLAEGACIGALVLLKEL
jgi:hypothetical protein